MSTSTAPAPTSILFARGVVARLKSWPTLSLAVQENWGGPNGAEKRTWLASVIVDAFEEQADAPDDQYVEEMLLQVMSDEFDTEVEDGTAEVVAIDICKIWEETRSGVQALVLKFEASADKIKGKKIEVPQVADDEWEDDDEDGESEDGNEDEDMEDPAPQLIDTRAANPEPEVDEEGFTLVKGKGRR